MKGLRIKSTHKARRWLLSSKAGFLPWRHLPSSLGGPRDLCRQVLETCWHECSHADSPIYPPASASTLSILLQPHLCLCFISAKVAQLLWNKSGSHKGLALLFVEYTVWFQRKQALLSFIWMPCVDLCGKRKTSNANPLWSSVVIQNMICVPIIGKKWMNLCSDSLSRLLSLL